MYSYFNNLPFQTYRDSMQKLHLMTDGELEQIFGPIDDLMPIHEGNLSLLVCILSESQYFVLYTHCFCLKISSSPLTIFK